ncbi:MFS transporter [Alicyclobacillus sp. ALC3]|uniref:MFS transporter n=1 Tax=Alicyclobacillus sp. ALC3 TaxID=2796143 RepID=UPI002378BCAC|nr:MFS transporter [Alicyclobacillus sp. ALC3]WDL97712.1 MFS transporter [Alicyclobacillus sp. ALC3]
MSGRKNRKLLLFKELNTYPVGGYRIWLLVIALLANVVAYYEGQMSAVLPLILTGLHMSLTTYGLISAGSTAAGAIGAYYSGRLADSRGRVFALVPSLFVTAFCVYAMVLVHSALGLLVIRVVLSLVEGSAVTATAGLVRDFSPRSGRAIAYAFWGFGPTGSALLATSLAGWTLPVWHTWQSQFYIEGTISLVLAILVAFNIADLSPNLRAEVIDDVSRLKAIRHADVASTPAVKHNISELLRYPHVWASLIGISMFLVSYYTLSLYGPTMLVKTFRYSTAQAAGMLSIMWLMFFVFKFVASYVSDRLQLRKVFSLVGGIGAFVALLVLSSDVKHHVGHRPLLLGLVSVGIFLGVAYTPWMAMFSETMESIRPALQGSGWGVFGLFVRVMVTVLLVAAPLMTAKAHSWAPWLYVMTISEFLFIPALLFMKGSWRRPVPQSLESVSSNQAL